MSPFVNAPSFLVLICAICSGGVLSKQLLDVSLKVSLEKAKGGVLQAILFSGTCATVVRVGLKSQRTYYTTFEPNFTWINSITGYSSLGCYIIYSSSYKCATACVD